MIPQPNNPPPATAYLILTLSKCANGPVVARIYSEYPLTMTNTINKYQLLIAKAEGRDFQHAQSRLVRKLGVACMASMTVGGPKFILKLPKIIEPKSQNK